MCKIIQYRYVYKSLTQVTFTCALSINVHICSMYYIQKGRGGGVVFNEPIAHILYGAHARAVPGNHAHFVSAACPTPRCILTGSFWHLS